MPTAGHRIKYKTEQKEKSNNFGNKSSKAARSPPENPLSVLSCERGDRHGALRDGLTRTTRPGLSRRHVGRRSGGQPRLRLYKSKSLRGAELTWKRQAAVSRQFVTAQREKRLQARTNGPSTAARPGCLDQVSDGEAALLRQGGREEGAVDGGGGPEARRLPPQPRPLLLARGPQARRAAEVREELQAPVDQLPEARSQARPPLRRRGEARHRPARAARQQVVQDRGAAAREDGQRDQEPLEHPHPEEAPQDGHRPRHPPAIAPGPCFPRAGAKGARRATATATATTTTSARAAITDRRRGPAGSGGGGTSGPAADPAGRDTRAPARGEPCFLRLGLGVLAVLLVRDGVAGAHVPVRHGRHHGRRLGRALPRRRRRQPRPVRPVPGRWLRPRRRLAVTVTCDVPVLTMHIVRRSVHSLA